MGQRERLEASRSRRAGWPTPCISPIRPERTHRRHWSWPYGRGHGQQSRGRGWRVIGYDIDAKAMAAARQKGIEVVDDAAAVAAAASDIITSLPSARAAIATAETIAAAAPAPRVVLEMSTLSLEDKEAFAAVLTGQGHIALDCPLSGTGAQAQAKDLVVYASGSSPEIERLGPLFLGLGRKVLQSRCLRQRHENEVRRQSVGCDSQRRQRRGHGAWDESRVWRRSRSWR